jgi:hypothetical protein
VPQLTALSRLDRLGPSTTAELARREQITSQAMGRVAIVLAESFTSEEIATLDAATRLIERLAELL